ncbi:hypothetical protein CUN85_04540 [Methanolobus halotolerans]|uniref:Rubrerythrin n=2 Tax=Methanolobus halotolerans TaxID=2052935 RepID=A0A4E0QSU9_9EURY|nr:hypothetical protein CUN85_04540 [Methanolobus halotolerans]
MYWVEMEMEQMGTWEGRLEMMDENLEALEILSHDSDKHGSIVEKWLRKAAIAIPEDTPKGLPKHIFDFEGLTSQEIFSKIVKYEILAMNAYKDMKNADSDVIITLFEDENDRTEFLEDLGQLIKDEEKHTSICNKQIGGYMKIKY